MDLQFISRMAKRANKGFTFVEVLVVMAALGVFTLLFMLPVYFSSKMDTNNIIEANLKAMALGKRVNITDSLWFNGRGNINQAQTIQYHGFTCVFQLGFGRFHCE